MANAIARADLRARLLAAGLGVPIAWPNEPFEIPDPPSPWISVELVGGDDVPIEVGGGLWSASGQSLVHVLVPTNSGVAASDALIDAVKTAFRGPPLEPVVHERIGADPGGPGTDDGLYWRTSVTADWHLQTYAPRS